MCGLLGHVEQYFEKLFDMDVDEGVREWGLELQADQRRLGGT